MKFNLSQGTRLSTFFEQVVDNEIKDSSKKENIYSRRHVLSDFRDNDDDHETDGEPIEKANAVRLAAESKMTEEWVGDGNVVDQLEEIAYQVAGTEDARDRWIVKGRYYLNMSNKEIGTELGLSDDTVQRRKTNVLAELMINI